MTGEAMGKPEGPLNFLLLGLLGWDSSLHTHAHTLAELCHRPRHVLHIQTGSKWAKVVRSQGAANAKHAFCNAKAGVYVAKACFRSATLLILRRSENAWTGQLGE